MEEEKPGSKRAKSESHSNGSPCRGDMTTSWSQEEKTFYLLNPYQSPFPFPSRALKKSLEPEQKKFMEKVLSLLINASFLKSMAKLPKFAKDVMKNRKDLEKALTIVLNELCSTTIINGLPIKMGYLGQLTLPCEFGNSTSINALADSRVSINLMPYFFYQNLSLPKLQDTRMRIRMVVHSTTYPQGVFEDLFVRVGKFVFPVDFVVLDMKEDEELPKILGRRFLNTARA
ncbi:uncharacterized protein LOC111913084 [Lactuca sativa]|uniref:uncharacterized protein LOC111913084 n=1 Tax=Lactuca sativa TaxID=4236 RepID=UPI000CD8CC33|nr:uncharacterized protein LOC111913084 [Lactuca sativa]